MTTAAAPTIVHIEIPHFHAIYEGAVAWDACGPVANEVAVAALQGRTPDTGNAAKARARDLAAGKMHVGSGEPLSSIEWDLQQRGYTALEVIPYAEPANNAALHALVKRGALNQWPVIIQVARAYNLPDNEAGVQYHFVVVGGIDSVKGYLLANGDTKTGIAQHPAWPAVIPLNWATWDTITAAGVCGAILVKPKGWTPPAPAPEPVPTPEPAPVPEPAPAPTPDPMAAQVAILTAQVAQLTSEAQAAAAQAAQAVVEAVAASQAAAQAANDVATLKAALKAL